MNSTATRNERIAPQQLTLLSDSTSNVTTRRRGRLAASDAPAQFRLSKSTRERGLAHVAEIREQLAAAQARLDAASHQALPPRRQAA